MPRQGSSAKTKWLQMRSCKRVSSQVPVIIDWTKDGHGHKVEGRTTDVGRQGCLIVTDTDVPMNLRIRLINKASQQIADATVVWKEQNTSEGWDLGIELINPSPEFWSQQKSSGPR